MKENNPNPEKDSLVNFKLAIPSLISFIAGSAIILEKHGFNACGFGQDPLTDISLLACWGGIVGMSASIALPNLPK